MEPLLHQILARQDEIYRAIIISNWLAVAGRVLEVFIALGLVYDYFARKRLREGQGGSAE